MVLHVTLIVDWLWPFCAFFPNALMSASDFGLKQCEVVYVVFYNDRLMFYISGVISWVNLFFIFVWKIYELYMVNKSHWLIWPKERKNKIEREISQQVHCEKSATPWAGPFWNDKPETHSHCCLWTLLPNGWAISCCLSDFVLIWREIKVMTWIQVLWFGIQQFQSAS